ncbi:AbrB/MazE/SpoVT family DNA-binding domain-containing protein [Clostridium sp. 19966]|uniref:AbrB/MazE/SpoVT family DNA-binding domain-containing protein n=1 Tax=Clostridium sp. 19966 TaxID=2768166 RepID=UPI0028E04C36|nr:AbrB/MazE/SpoVT family DNA-binding domain-containing protein [Clostridium sp. 19966]MDT8718286.1 AbrB/MazE/SpoVT family DNA-binding domain-containing protein [Clostridium sp. 19966]
MKAIGIVRKVDELGRIVIPRELRKVKGINEQDPLEIYVDGDDIILRKYEPSCIFCGESENITEFHQKRICKNCLAEIKKG